MKICAECRREIYDHYYMIGDNFLQAKYFDENDGSDNVFCSEGCLLSSLSVLSVDLSDVDMEDEI